MVKSLASSLTIGSGGSAGREGPIVQIGSALGSSVGQMLKLSDDRVSNLVACGAAAGIAATFNAPIAVKIRATVRYNDYETASYNREDGIYFFLHEPHEVRDFEEDISAEIAFRVNSDTKQIEYGDIVSFRITSDLEDICLSLDRSDIVEDLSPEEWNKR